MKVEHWKYYHLGDVCSIIGGGTPDKSKHQYYTGDIPWATVRDLKSENIFETEFKITTEAIKNSSTNIIKSGNTIIATRVGLGKVSIATYDTAINQDLKGIIPKNKTLIINRFLFRWLCSISQKIIDKGVGATVKGVKLDFIKSLKVPTPSVEEQHRIVAILDDAFERIDKAIANTERNIVNAKELFESFLDSIVCNMNLQTVDIRLGDIEYIQIIDGDRGASYPKKEEFSHSGYCVFLNTKNVLPDGFNFESVTFITQEKDTALRKGKIKKRDVVMTTRGTIGNIGIYDSSVPYEHIRINSGMLIFRTNEKLIVAEYLFELLRSRIIKYQIGKSVTGAAQPQLPINILSNFVIPVPVSVAEQKQLVEIIRNEYSLSKQSLDIFQTKLNSLRTLKQSLLAAAFSGELTADFNPDALEL